MPAIRLLVSVLSPALAPVSLPTLAPVKIGMTTVVGITRSSWFLPASVKPWRSCLNDFSAITIGGCLPSFFIKREEQQNTEHQLKAKVMRVQPQINVSQVSSVLVDKKPVIEAITNFTNIANITNRVTPITSVKINKLFEQNNYYRKNIYQHQRNNLDLNQSTYQNQQKYFYQNNEQKYNKKQDRQFDQANHENWQINDVPTQQCYALNTQNKPDIPLPSTATVLIKPKTLSTVLSSVSPEILLNILSGTLPNVLLDVLAINKKEETTAKFVQSAEYIQASNINKQRALNCDSNVTQKPEVAKALFKPITLFSVLSSRTLPRIIPRTLLGVLPVNGKERSATHFVQPAEFIPASGVNELRYQYQNRHRHQSNYQDLNQSTDQNKKKYFYHKNNEQKYNNKKDRLHDQVNDEHWRINDVLTQQFYALNTQNKSDSQLPRAATVLIKPKNLPSVFSSVSPGILFNILSGTLPNVLTDVLAINKKKETTAKFVQSTEYIQDSNINKKKALNSHSNVTQKPEVAKELFKPTALFSVLSSRTLPRIIPRTLLGVLPVNGNERSVTNFVQPVEFIPASGVNELRGLNSDPAPIQKPEIATALITPIKLISVLPELMQNIGNKEARGEFFQSASYIKRLAVKRLFIAERPIAELSSNVRRYKTSKKVIAPVLSLPINWQINHNEWQRQREQDADHIALLKAGSSKQKFNSGKLPNRLKAKNVLAKQIFQSRAQTQQQQATDTLKSIVQSEIKKRQCNKFNASQEQNLKEESATYNSGNQTSLIKMVTELMQTIHDLQTQITSNQQHEQQRFQQLMNNVNSSGMSLNHSAQERIIPTNLPVSFFDPL